MDHETEVLVVGGGLGGVAAALAALRLGRTVVLTEESPWLGGQLTSQAVPPDENAWVETFGAAASYRRLRTEIRELYRRHYPLTESARASAALNPGDGRVSPLCHEPKVALTAIHAMLAPYRANRRLTVLTGTRPHSVEVDGDTVTAVRFERDGDHVTVRAPYVLDATELGDVVEQSGTESVVGAESRDQTGELHALDGAAQPLDQQSFTWCFAMDFREGEDWTIDRPAGYGFWRDFAPGYWPGPLLSWTDVRPDSLAVRTHPLFTDAATPTGGHGIDRWTFRRILSARTFTPGFLASDVTLVNWPQNDYVPGPLVGVEPAERQRHLEAARELSRSLLYWMQTEAPRHDGGTGYPGLRPRGDLLRDGTADDAGLALRPYVRESRRIAGELTVVEEHVGVEARRAAGLPVGSEVFPDSVGIGCYRIDLHPSSGSGTPRTYVDIACHPFQVPLGALLPVRMDNLIAAAKNIATTHITNGGYRLHPVEWTIGEAAGALAAYALGTGLPPRAVRAKPDALAEFQRLLSGVLGAELAWPDRIRTRTV
ncbi:FAD-dependent oxidoreductase [Jiangella muralis]|uniref:FAD-dependent oxidoreductase n=1 Tax=Jiangella muralis TaxID=702383 RepID=UPI00069F4683|nr:FAD-dependent oxidoreductase [Jiangella muralis]